MLKTVHVLSVTLFFGAGLGSVLLKLAADRSKEPRVVAFAHRTVVLADWVFTIPSAVLLPTTGAAMVAIAGLEWRAGWVAWGLVLYAIAGCCWLPAWRLQFRMAAAADAWARDGTPLPPQFQRWTRTWALLGIPAFLAVVGAVYVMVAKGFAVG